VNRLIGTVSALLLGLLLLVPVAAAADFSDRTERIVISGGTDTTLPTAQTVDVLVVYNGHARVEGSARTIFVVNGSVDLVGGHAATVVGIRSQIRIDGTSAVTGDIGTLDSTVASDAGATLGGRIRDLGPDVVSNWLSVGGLLFFIYLAFAISAIAGGIVLAGVAARQVRAATTAITREPVQVVGASIIGLVAVLTVAILAMVTVVGIPFGLGVLMLVLPALLVAGYLVAGIWVGEIVVGRMAPTTERTRPYLAALVGLVIVGVIGIIPVVGGLISLAGFGAILLLMWRAVRRDSGPVVAGHDASRVVHAAG
jgi:hypothetical protein